MITYVLIIIAMVLGMSITPERVETVVQERARMLAGLRAEASGVSAAEARWVITRLAELQRQLLESAIELAADWVVYSTCSLEPEEGEVAEVGVELGFRMAVEVATPRALMGMAVARDLAPGAHRAEPVDLGASVESARTAVHLGELIRLADAAGTVVYTKALSPSLNEPTIAGTAGTWTIALTMTNYSGTMNFRVQKL